MDFVCWCVILVLVGLLRMLAVVQVYCGCEFEVLILFVLLCVFVVWSWGGVVLLLLFLVCFLVGFG